MSLRSRATTQRIAFWLIKPPEIPQEGGRCNAGLFRSPQLISFANKVLLYRVLESCVLISSVFLLYLNLNDLSRCLLLPRPQLPGIITTEVHFCASTCHIRLIFA